MVYSNKLIMCILFNGLPLKELANGVVSLPFGAEYSLRFRNKNNRRAVVQIYIDGENVSGAGYIVGANDYVDIKRHHDVDRSFKFVSLDSPDAVEHGKNGPNEDKVKGTIEARFFLEKERPPVVYHYPIKYIYGPQWGNTCDSLGTTSFRSGEVPSNTVQPRAMSFNGLRSCNEQHITAESLQDGCTVEGNLTGQTFHSVWCDTETTFTSVKLFLQGYDDSVPVKKTKKKAKNRSYIQDLERENENLKKKIEDLKKLKDKKSKEKELKEANEDLRKQLLDLQDAKE